MASRGKKKAIQTSIVLAQTEQNKEINKADLANKKLDVTLGAVLALVLLSVLILILGASVIGVTINADISSLSQEQEEAIQESSDQESSDTQMVTIDVAASMLVVLIAPTQGVTSGFDFVLTNADNIPKTKLAYEIYSQLAKYLVGEEKINSFESLSLFIYVLSAVIIVLFIATAVIACIDRFRKKKGILMTLISTSLLEASVLVMLVTCIITMIQGMTTKMSIIPTWGIWIIFFALAGMLAYEIYYIVTKNKNGAERKNIKDEKVS